MKLRTLSDLLVEQLRDLYSAEGQLVKALPKMAKGATCDKLRAAIESHLEETKGQVSRLEQIFEQLEASPKGKKCRAMEGLVLEGKEALEEDMEPAIRDAAIIAAAQRVEHYEMAAYGTARTFATVLGKDEVAELLQETLDEEAAANDKLTEIATDSVNHDAAEVGVGAHSEE